jgi:hypothetical protein
MEQQQSSIRTKMDGFTVALSNLAQFWGEVIEAPFRWLGLMTSQPKRFFVTGAITAAALLLFQPESLFNKDGEPRPWAFLHPDSEDAATLDWLAVTFLVASFSVIFV